FSFGSLFYEMLTGQKAFNADSKLSTLAAIVKEEPRPIRQVVPGIPPELERIVNRCLRKDPDRRFHHMQDLKIELEELKEQLSSAKRVGTQPKIQAGWRKWIWMGVTVVIAATAVAVWFSRGKAGKPTEAPRVVPLTSYRGLEVDPSFSPDG